MDELTGSSASMRLSIITPATDRSRYIEEMLASVPRDELADIEHLIVYDGEPNFALDLAKRHPYLQFIDGGGLGPAYAAGRGVAAASGDFILFLNSDDRLLPGSLARLVECANAQPDIAIWTGGTRIFRTDSGGCEVTLRILDGRDMTALTLANVLYDIPLLTARFVRLTALASVGGINDAFPFGNDREFMLRCVLAGLSEAPLGIRISELRLHSESLTINDAHSVVPRYLWEHLVIADETLARTDLTPNVRATIRRWRAAEVARLTFLQVRAGNPAGALTTFAHELARDITWWLRAPAALGGWLRRRRTNGCH